MDCGELNSSATVFLFVLNILFYAHFYLINFLLLFI